MKKKTMASVKPIFLLAICFALILVVNRFGDDLLHQVPKSVGSDSVELSELKLKIQQLESSLEKHWNEHAKPTADAILQKAVEKKADAERWAETHVETIKTKWIPSIKEQWLMVSANVKPHVQSVCDKAHEVYVASKTAATPHVLKAQELADPYFQSSLEKHWNEHAKPTADAILQKAVEKKADAERWAEPHIETIKMKWIPSIKEQWSIVSANVKPHVQSLCDKAHGVYVASKTAATPHVLKAQELADHTFSSTIALGDFDALNLFDEFGNHIVRIQRLLNPGNGNESGIFYH